MSTWTARSAPLHARAKPRNANLTDHQISRWEALGFTKTRIDGYRCYVMGDLALVPFNCYENEAWEIRNGGLFKQLPGGDNLPDPEWLMRSML